MPTTIAPQTGSAARRRTFLVLSGLALLTFAIYGQVFHHEFLTLDDADAITANPIVQAGLTPSGIRWAFTNFSNGTWQPLIWISWMVDCQFFGLHSGAHHLANVFYHLLNVFLFFICLRKMTGSTSKAAFAAFLFAAHPLRVESVAWAVERKDTLSALFFLMSWLAYLFYVRKNKPGLMGLTAFFFALACMSKPMAVSLPICLLIMDAWLLQRQRPWRELILEKTPLWILAAAAAAITCIGAGSNKAINAANFPLTLRVGNALVSYILYLYKTFFPFHLSVFYPFPPDGQPALAVLAAALFLILITAGVLHARKKYPFLAFGWFWYLVTLIPVIGIVQMGGQSMADRFTYIPHMGLLTALTWDAMDRKAGKIILTAVIGIFSFLSWHQTSFWKSSLTLHEHDLKVTKGNYLAHTNLGLYYEQKGDFEKAAEHYAKSIEIKPGNADVLNNFGNVLLQTGRLEESEKIYSLIEKNSSGHVDSLVNLGLVSLEKQDGKKAELYFKRALALDAGRVKAWLGLASIEMARGRESAADEYLRKALLLAPENEEANYMAANFEVSRKNYAAAKSYYEKTLKAVPRHFKAAYNLGNVFFLEGKYSEALKFYEKALKIKPDFELAREQAEKARLKLEN